LNLAVRGRLVPQDPNDEPVSFLIERINHGKHPQNFDIPFPLPDGWSWTRLHDLLEADRGISYGIIKLGQEPTDGGIPTLRCSDVKSRYIDLNNVRTVSPNIEKDFIRTRLQGGEVLLNIRGTLGGVASVPINLRGYNIAREVAMIPFHRELVTEFLVNVMASPYFWNKILENLRGLAYKGINLSALRTFEFPLPPLAEQHRIVTKVDELMTLCDQLESYINESSSTRAKLLEAALYEALNGKT
jgi:type I restriction enzyme S subunit